MKKVFHIILTAYCFAGCSVVGGWLLFQAVFVDASQPILLDKFCAAIGCTTVATCPLAFFVVSIIKKARPIDYVHEDTKGVALPVLYAVLAVLYIPAVFGFKAIANSALQSALETSQVAEGEKVLRIAANWVFASDIAEELLLLVPVAAGAAGILLLYNLLFSNRVILANRAAYRASLQKIRSGGVNGIVKPVVYATPRCRVCGMELEEGSYSCGGCNATFLMPATASAVEQK